MPYNVCESHHDGVHWMPSGACVPVYSQFEMDGWFQQHVQAHQSITDRLTVIEGTSIPAINQAIEDAEHRLQNEVVASINNLPQRILAEETARVLKDLILAELRQELAQLRADLQRQIDELVHHP